MTEITVGSKVSMHFSLTLEDGTVAEETFSHEPITFTVGDGTMIEGLELALYGLRPGDEQVVTMEPQQTFGFHDPDNIHDMPRDEFDKSMALKEGMVIGFTTPAGDEVPGSIVKIDPDFVKVDFNHPLAGHDLIFRVRILSVQNENHNGH
jgi:FKBP-type peptidyl-prolyl cis-trans isomerase SlpA